MKIVLRNLGFILLLALLSLIYIYNSNRAEGKLRQVAKLNKSVEDAKSQYQDVKSDINFKCTETQLAKILERNGLKKNLLRVYLIFFAFFLLAMIIMAKVVKTAVVEGDKWRAEGGKHIKLVDVEGERGNIYSANGNLLATSLPYFDIKVDLLTSSDANFNKNIDGLSSQLAKHFGKTKTSWKETLTSSRVAGKAKIKGSNAGYYPLLNKVSKDELDLRLG